MRDLRAPFVAGVAALLLVVGCGIVAGIHLELVLVGVVAVAFLAVATTTVALAVRHARLTAHLRRASRRGMADGVEFEVLPGVMPSVAGLVRPRIFVDDQALRELDAGQRRAVLFHEQAHRDRRDPVRLVVLEAVRLCLGWIPVVAAAERSARAHLEIRADRQALARGVTRGDVAGALLHLAPASPVTATATFGAVAEQRLRALVDEGGDWPGRRGWAWLAGAVVLGLGVATCLTLSSTAHPEFAWLLDCLEATCSLP